jgi:lincosamide and streptogramin A transport system ATP-binding/permease protein
MQTCLAGVIHFGGTMSNITIKNMSFAYDGNDHIFNQVNLNLDSSWRLGLIGRNGRGKTTLLNILQNKLPYNGSIESNVNFKYFPQTINDPNIDVTSLLVANVSISDHWQVDRELSYLGIDFDDIANRTFSTLSGGEQTKLLLAMTFIDDQSFILLDEPTNHLDAQTRQQIIQYLNRKSGFIVVSHDRSLLNTVIDHVVAIEQTQLRLYRGNFEIYEQEKAARDQSELAENSRLKHDIQRLSETAREKAQWSQNREKSKLGNRTEFNSKNRGDKGFEGARAARTMKKAKSLVNRNNDEIAHKETLLQDIETADVLSMKPLNSPHQTLLSFDAFSVQYTEKPLFEPLSFTLKQGDIVALTGNNGVGKSSIIQALKNQNAVDYTGTIHIASQLKISYVKQDTSHLTGTLREFSTNHDVSYDELLGMLYKLGVPRQVFTQRIEDMSEGQRKRVELAKSLITPAHVFIWDEPLNYLDVFNQEQIQQLILTAKPTLLLIEHDQTFLRAIHAKQIALIPNQ